jgi:uncharacterized lipoprotein NlpE involved in copper resistance
MEMMKKQILALCLVLAFTMGCTKQEEVAAPAAEPAVVAPAEQEVDLAEQSEPTEQEVALAEQSELNAEEEEEEESAKEASEQK